MLFRASVASNIRVLDRLKFSAACLWAGLHLIYWGCIEAGSDNYSNPACAFLQAIVTFEKRLLMTIVILGMLLLMYRNLSREQNVTQEKTLEVESIKPLPQHRQEVMVQATPAQQLKYEPEPIQPKVLTIEELKAKAIQAILRK